MLSASEFIMQEPLPLARVHEVIFEFCRGRGDACLFGAQAVNVYTSEPRMTANVDILSPTPAATAEALAAHLHSELHIAARVREVKPSVGYRVYQVGQAGNRHLADVRLEPPENDATVVGGLRVTSPSQTIAMKVLALAKRRLAPKGGTDLADIRRLLLTFPALRSINEDVTRALHRLGPTPEELALWAELVAAPLAVDEDDGY